MNAVGLKKPTQENNVSTLNNNLPCHFSKFYQQQNNLDKGLFLQFINPESP